MKKSLVSLAAAATYLYLIAPGAKREVELPKSGFAHRGLWNSERPENSLSAFSAAVDAGLAIELDVQLSADRIPVVFHDETLSRMCGVDRRVCDCTLDELKALRLNGSDETVPTFAEVLDTVGGKVALLVELKGTSLDTSLCDIVLPMLRHYRGKYFVESFNPMLLNRVKKLSPKIIRGQLVTATVRRKIAGNKLRNFALSALLTDVFSRPDFIAYDIEYPNGVSVNIATKLLGAKACVWTVRNKNDYLASIEKGLCPIFEGFDVK